MVRQKDRYETLAYWPAEDMDTGESVGLVTNFTTQGIQIHSKRLFRKWQRLRIRIHVDEALAGRDEICITIQNAWCKPSAVRGLNFAGFRITHMSPLARSCLKQLLNSFSYLAPAHAARGSMSMSANY